MKVVILLVAAIAAVYTADVPLGALQAVRNGGLDALKNVINADNERLVKAVEAFKPINATCTAKLNQAIPRCRSCVENKCKSRAQAVCKPEQWQVILGKTIGFFKDGIPNFFSSTIPDVFVNKIGGGIVDVTKDIGKFFEDKIGGGIIDIGTKIGDGIVDFGKDAIGGVVDVANKIGSGITDVGKKIGDGVNKAIDGIKDIGSKIGDFGSKIGGAFKSLFGKREELSHQAFLRSRRAGEPGCGDFERSPEEACKFYLKPQYCADCGFDSNKMCPGFKAATDEIKAANAQRQWLASIQQQNYDIKKMTFNPASMSNNGGFNNVVVSVNLFGKDLQFTLRQAINPYIPQTAGPIVATQAIEEYKKH